MKNIVLMARGFNMLLLAAALCLVACNKKDDPTPEQDLHGDVTRPTWTVPETYDYTSSMTAVIKVVSLNGQMVNDSIVNESDLLAAFSGETCLGATSPQDGLFYLFITWSDDQINDQMVNEKMVNLRYYSAHYKNLFEAKDAFPYSNDSHLGTIAEPLIPQFVIIK